MSYLVNTNILSELAKEKPNQSVIKWFKFIPDDEIYMSALTLGEIRKGIETIKDLRKKEKLRIWLEHELPDWFGDNILPINKSISDRWGRLLAEINRSLPAIDSLIAATALHYDFALVTRNTKDFDYPALEIINPWK